MTAISAMLNSSGENAVSANRPAALNSAIITVTGPAKAEVRQHQPRIVDRELQRLVAGKSRRQHR